MSPKNSPSLPFKPLRKIAEATLTTSRMQVKKMSMREIQQLVHELQVHQVELEMQNEQLRETQQELETARDRYAELYDFAPVGFLTLNRQGNILEANLTACQLLGMERKALIHEKLERFVSSSDQPTLRRHLNHVRQGHLKDVSDVLRLKHTHAPYFVRLESLYVNDEVQTTESLLRIALIDVTEKENVERALRDTQKLSHQVFESSPDHIAVVGHDYCYRQVNHAYELAHGLPQQEIIGMPVTTLLGEEVFQKIVKPYFDRALAGETVSFESWFSFRTLKNRFMAVTYTPLRTGDRANNLIVVIARDCTDRKLADEALVKSEAQRRLAMGAAKVGTWTWDISTNEMVWSENVEELFGLPLRSFTGTYQAYLDFIHPSDLSAVNEAMLKTVNHHKPFNIEHRIIWPDRTIHWLSCQGCLFRDSSGKPLWMAGTIIDVTERKQAEEALRESQAKYEGIIRTAMDAVISVDGNQRIIVFNPAAENMFRCPAENAVGASLDQFIPRRFRHAHRRYIEEFDHTGITPGAMGRPATVYGRRTNGEEFPIETSISKVGVGENKLYTVILRDITARVEAEQALQRSEERLDLALKSANLGVWDWNPQTGTGPHDTRWLKMLGYNVEELDPTFESWEQLLHPEDIPSVLKTLHDHLDNLTPFYQTEYRIRMKNGKWKWILDTGKVVNRDVEGNPLRVTGTHQDITDRKEAEAALQESEERFQAFMNHSPTVAYLKDEQGRYVYVNARFEQELDFAPGTCLGKTDRQLFPPEVARALKTHDRKTLASGEVLESEQTTLDTRGQVRPWLVYTFPVHRGSGQQFLGGVALDITQRKHAEEALQQREEELQALGGQLISAQEDERRRISRELHDDMNQRLAVLALKIQTAQRGLPDTDPVNHTLQALYAQVSSLSDDIRKMAYQLHPSILDDLGLEVALQSFVNDFSRREGVQMKVTTEGVALNLTQNEASCLYRVAQESLRNIARHAEASHGEVSLREDIGNITLRIKDNGKGFDLKAVRSDHHGLGLISMQERARLIHGTLSVNSSPGHGTEICLLVPLSKRRSPRKARRVQSGNRALIEDK